MILSNLALGNRVTVLVLIVLIGVCGVYSYVTLPREAAPDVPVPFVLISTVYEGVSPEDVESSVTMKIEKKLTGLKGVKEIRSSSSEGFSMVSVEFLPDVAVDDALRRVKDKVDQAKGELPTGEDRKEPTVSEVNIAEFPIMLVNISGDVSMVRMKEIAERVEDAIEGLPGVLDCEVYGTLEREIRLEIDQDRVAAYGLTIPELLRLIPQENVNVSAGSFETPGTKFTVRLGAEFTEPDEVDHLLLTVRNGKPIYLADVARVVDTFKDRLSYSRLDGRNAVTLAVKKRVGANILDIAAGVKAVLGEAERQAPAGVRFMLTMDQSKDIRSMLADLENNMFAAIVLVLVVLFLFMGWRAAIIVATVVPLSMLMSFTILQMLGYTLNMIVLFSLVLATGMLVDNAIVIVENIYRHRQLGYSRLDAAIKSAAEVAWPVITSTLTTVVAFLPMIFWPGIMGDFMKYLPITVIIVLSCSLFVALVISPVLCTLTRYQPPRRRDSWFMRGYRKVLAVALSHRATTLAVSFLLLIGMAILYARRGAGVEFFPDIDPRQAVVNVRCPQGTNILETDRILRQIEQLLARHRPDLQYVIASAGTGGGGNDFLSGAGGGNSPHNGTVTLVFHDFEQRPRPSVDVMHDVRRELVDLHGAEVTLDKQKEGPPTGKPVTVQIIGPDFRKLEDLSREAGRLIANVPGLVNLHSDLEATRPEIPFIPDRQRAMLLGVNTWTVGNFLKTCLFGSKVGTYRQFNDEYDITVRLPERQRASFEDIFRLRVPNDAGKAVPLSSLGRFDFKGGYGTIYRINQNRVVTLTGDAEGRLGPDVLRDAQDRLKDLRLPPGYSIQYAGEQEEQDRAQAFLLKAFIIALLLITLALVAQFNTLTVPAIIMTTVPLSLIGVFLGLLACHMPFGIIMTGIAVISLAGVVVNNAIVLLDYTRLLQQRGMGMIEAAVEAGATRLRPVFLTAGTTVIGLLPTALGMSFDVRSFEWVTRSESTQWWQGMAVAVIFGLSFATLLTLVFVPTLYVSLYRLAAKLGLGGLKKTGVSQNAPAAATEPPTT